MRGSSPIPLIDSSPQGRRLQPPGTEVECEVDDRGKPHFWFRGQNRAVAQGRRQRRLQIARQIVLGFHFGDRRMLGIAEMPVPNRPEACRADVGIRTARIALRHAVKALEALCLEPRSELKEFMDRGAKIALSASSPNAILPFAWGATITNYPFFARVTELVGRLTSIQGSCNTSEVHRRMSEIYGERHNVRVATQAVIQSLVDWAVVTRSQPEYRLTPKKPLTVSDHEYILWLIEAMVRQAGKPIPLENINSSPLGFPFYFDAPISYLVSGCDHLELRLEGASKQFVALRSGA